MFSIEQRFHYIIVFFFKWKFFKNNNLQKFGLELCFPLGTRLSTWSTLNTKTTVEKGLEN